MFGQPSFILPVFVVLAVALVAMPGLGTASEELESEWGSCSSMQLPLASGDNLCPS
jgi:hypothetical protein